MADISGIYNVIYNEKNVGTVEVSKRGPRTLFLGECATLGDEVFRLAAETKKGIAVIGVMMPSGGKLSIKKEMTQNDLNEKGIESLERFIITGQETVQRGGQKAERGLSDILEEHSVKNVENGNDKNSDIAGKKLGEQDSKILNSPDEARTWKEIDSIEGVISNDEVVKSGGSLTGALLRECGQMQLLAVPLSSEEPFPLMSIFCFGTEERVNGNDYIVFKIKNGNFC